MRSQDLLLRLVEAIESKNSFPQWDTIISILALFASWLTIALLLKELKEKNRPYLQISFELVRSSLACIVLKNTGTCPLIIKSIKFNEDFIKQLPLKCQKILNQKADTKMAIFPNRQLVISFDVNVFEILRDFEQKIVVIDYSYSKIGKRKKKYKENVSIDFEEYEGILLYISDLDEFKNSVNNLNRTIVKLIDITKSEDDTVARLKESQGPSH